LIIAFIYINAKTKGIIICPEHGNFMKSPEKHIKKDSNGCNKCYYDKRRNTKREKYPTSKNNHRKATR
jgi:DNA-directed RNA polymerase subunit M/transcription elongation factor TFIIS